MGGFITKRTVVIHTRYIVVNYGLLFYYYCLTSKNKTFLGLLVEKGKI